MIIITVVYAFHVILYRALAISRNIRLREVDVKYPDSEIFLEQNVSSRSKCAVLCLDHHCTGNVQTQLDPETISCQLFRDYPMKSASYMPTANVFKAGKFSSDTFKCQEIQNKLF
jgi:hypothetical protein